MSYEALIDGFGKAWTEEDEADIDAFFMGNLPMNVTCTVKQQTIVKINQVL